MSELIFPELQNSNRFMDRNKNSLLKKFKLSSGNQLHNSAIYANYMVALGHTKEAIIFLESYVNKIEFNGDNIDQWGHVGQSIVLLSYLYGTVGEDVLANFQCERIITNDINSGNKADDLRYYLSEHETEMEYSATEKQKHACEILSQETLRFIYFYVMWSQFKCKDE